MNFMVQYYNFFLRPPVLRDWVEVYRATPVWSFMLALIFFLFFYYFLNTISAKYYKLKHWWYHVTIVLIVTFFTAFFISYYGVKTAKLFEIIAFSAVNGATFVFVFVLLSFLFKFKSPHARFTPVKLFCK